jgi:hypothetical protein
MLKDMKNFEKITCIAICLLSTLCYAIMLIYLPHSFIGLHWQYDYVVTPSLFGLLYYFTRKINGVPQTLISFSVTLLVCGLVLSEVLGIGVSSGTALAGRMPYSDASAYLDGAISFLNSGKLSVWMSRRPLATLWLSLNLFLTGDNLRGALALMTFFGAWGIALVSGSVRKCLGDASGWMIHVVSFFWYRAFIGTTLSEQAGFFFGCIGFSLLWKAVSGSGYKISWPLGLFVMTAALVARASAFFVLPMLILWRIARCGRDKRVIIRNFAASVCAVLLVFGLNNVLLRVSGYPEAAFGNFAPTLYGLLHGGIWTQAYSDHPEISDLPDIEQNKKIYELSFKKLREQPSSLIKGSIRAYKSFFLSPTGSYSFLASPLVLSLDFHNYAAAQKAGVSELKKEFLNSEPWKIYYFSTAFLWFLIVSVLALYGTVRLFIERSWYRWFVIMAGFGILLSVPFLPPWDAPLMRVYITVVPFFALLPSIALKRRREPEEADSVSGGWRLEAASVALCFAVIIFPMVIDLNSGAMRGRIPQPVSGGEIVKIIKGAYLKPDEGVILDKLLGQSELLAVKMKDDNIRLIGDIPRNFTIGIGYFPAQGSISYVCWDKSQDIVPGEWMEAAVSEGDFFRQLRFLGERNYP